MKISLLSFFSIFLFATTLLGQQSDYYSFNINGRDYTQIENPNQISSNFEKVKIGFPFNFNNKKNETIFISNEGWLSFDRNTSLKAIINKEETNSFISPLTFFNEYEATQNYDISFYQGKDKNGDFFVVQWIGEEIAFQTFLFENGSIEFTYSPNIINYKNKFESRKNYTFGIINSKLAIGHFPFEIKRKEIQQIESSFLLKNESLSIELKNRNKDVNRKIKTKTVNNSKGTINCYDWDTGTSGWTEVSTEWAWVNPNGTGSPNDDNTGGQECWVVAGNAVYSTYTDCELVSPVQDLSTGTNAQMTFYMWMDTEEYWDGGYLMAWDGSTWNQVPSADLSVPYDDDVDSHDAWTGTYAAWTAVTADLSGYTNSDFQIKFVFYSDGSTNGGGWAIDDVCFSNTANVACSGTPAAGTISSNITSFCGTGTPTLTATGYSSDTGITFQWQSSPDNFTWSDISGATSNTYTATPAITQTTYYRLNVSCSNSSLTSTTNTVTVTNSSETITGTNSDVSIACNNTATLTATATGGTINWYDVATGGSSLGTGSSFTTPIISQNTTFYCSTISGSSSNSVGKTTSDLSDGYYGSTGTGLVFDALSQMTIVSVKVYVQTAASDVSVQLLNSSGTVLNTADFASLGSGLQTLTLNFSVPTGTDYRLVSNNTTNLGRDYSSDPGVIWPFTLAGVCSITEGWLSSSSTSYYFFYDWLVSSGCESSRDPVNVIITSGISAPDCSTLTSPADGTTGLSPGGITLNWNASETACQGATSYKLYFGTDNPPTNIHNGTDVGDVLSYSLGVLTAPQTYYWKIIPTNSEGNATGCSVYSFTTEPSIIIGDGTTSTQYGTPYKGSWSDSRYQTIYTAAELTAAGLVANSTLTGLSFNVDTKGSSQAYSGFTINLAHTSASDYPTTDFYNPTWTTVYSNNYSTSAGWNEHVFTTDFIWNGYDNLIVQTCFNNSSSTSADPVFYTATTGNTVTYSYDSSTDGCSTTADTKNTYRANIKFTYNAPVYGENTITIGSGSEPTTIASTIDTQGEALLNFDFTVKDDGSTPATDNDPTLINKLIFKQGTGNDVIDWSTAIAGAQLIDDAGHSQTTDVTINATSIVFSNINNGNNTLGRINDNANKTYTLKIWLNCPTSANDGDNFVFEVDNYSFFVETSGSSAFKNGENENSGATNNELTVDATVLHFVTDAPPTQVSLGVDFSVTVNATDDCGNIDLDYTNAITLDVGTGTGTLSSSAGLTQNLVAGSYTWSGIQYDVAEVFTITANNGSFSELVSWNINCIAEIIIGDGTGTSSTVTPYQGFNDKGRMQIIYLADDLLSAGIIPGTILTGLSFDVDGQASTMPYSSLNIKMMHTSDVNFSSATWLTGTWTTVQNANDYSTSEGWNSHPFDTNFIWNGTDNLAIQVCFDNATYTSDDPVHYTSTTAPSVCYAETDTDSEIGCSLTAESTSSYRPNIKLTYIPLVGESDIVTAGNEVPNIDYSLYQDIAINNTSDGIKVWSFTLRDGGADLSDTDSDPTDLSQLKITKGSNNTVTSWANTIRQAAIFDGTTKIAEITVVDEELIFTGLTGLKANDNSSNTFDLYISFNNTVIDNEQFEFQIEKNKQYYFNSPSSYFSSFNTISSSANDDNKIVITATKLVFTEQPIKRQVNYEMFPMPEISAVDALGNIDTDFNNSVSITSTGNMTGDPKNYTMTNGVVTCNGIIHTVTALNRELTATSGLWSVTSDQFDIIDNPCVITTTPAHTDGELYICLGATIDFEGSVTSGTPTLYSWEMGDGQTASTQTISNYEYTTASGYYVRLTMEYDSGTKKCATDLRVMISDGPTINSVSQDIQSCYGGTYDLTASGSGSSVDVTGYSGTGAVALSLADETYLPDIETDAEIYSSSIQYTQFDASSTLTSGDLVTVYANLEHSYWGDLTIWLECPNGQTDTLTNGHLTGWVGSGASATFLGEPVDEDVLGTKGTGMEYRWTMVSPTYESMDDISLISPFPYKETYVDNAGTTVTDHDYYPEGTYYPLENFSKLIGCPLNGNWTIYVKDYLGIDDGYIFEWGLELDESLMPGQWEYTFDIASYDWTGANVSGSHPTGATATVTPPNIGNNIYTLTVEDNHGCTTNQDVNIEQIICDATWNGSVDTNWDETGNWDNNIIPICLGGSVIIPDVVNDPIISGSANAFDLEIQAGANLTIAPNGNLTVCGTLTNTPGVAGLIVKSDATGTGSLIQNTANIQATVETYIEGLQYHYISSPISNATLAGIGISAGTYGTQFYSWDANLEWFGMGADPYGDPSTIDYNPWVNITSGNLDVGKGYAYYYETQTLSYQGTLNIDNINALSCGHASVTTGNDADQGWNFFGNPYSSSLDWDVIAGNISDGLEKTLYMFNDADGTGVQANYVYYIPSGGTVPSIGTSIATRFVPTGQGFFVRAPQNTDVLNINTNARIHGTTNFFKDYQDENVLRFVIENSNLKSDEMILRIVDVATSEFDGDYDARKLKPANSNIPIIYSYTSNNIETAINSFPDFNDETIIKIGLIANSGNYTIKAIEQTLVNGRKVYLIDNYESKIIEITNDKQYNFNYIGGLNNDRFELIFSNSNKIDDILKHDIIVSPNPSNGIFSVIVKNNISPYSITICNELGEVVFENKNYVNNNELDMSKQSSGIYFLNIKFNNGKTVNRKIIIN